MAVDLANNNGARVSPGSTPKEWNWIQQNKHKYNFQQQNDRNESHHYNYTKPGVNCTQPAAPVVGVAPLSSQSRTPAIPGVRTGFLPGG